jgi:N-acetylglutamate synthase-like GNAT family acetyltransferase
MQSVEEKVAVGRLGAGSKLKSDSGLVIRELQLGEDGSAFRALNEEWITAYFRLEDQDIKALANPENILLAGGRIYFADVDGVTVGCVALVFLSEGSYELSKMAVSPASRGAGIGRKLLTHVIDEARRLGATKLSLGSSSKLRNAVHLYESLGFEHVPRERVPWETYERADVFMEMAL